MMGRTSCFYGSITSCGYFCPVAEATAELHAIKFVVATAATGGRGNPVPDGEHQSEMVIQLSPTFNFWGECEKRSQSNPIKYPASQKRVILLQPTKPVYSLYYYQGPIQVGYLKSLEDQKTCSFLRDVITENCYCEMIK